MEQFLHVLEAALLWVFASTMPMHAYPFKNPKPPGLYACAYIAPM
jgi:hypothetical protein